HIDLPAIHFHVAMADQLARGGTSVSKAEMIADVVQSGFEDLQHLLTSHTAALERAFIHATKLTFEKAVVVVQLLLLDQAEAVIGVLAARFGTVDAWPIIAAFEIFGRAEDGHTETAADANAGTCITSHSKS